MPVIDETDVVIEPTEIQDATTTPAASKKQLVKKIAFTAATLLAVGAVGYLLARKNDTTVTEITES